MTELDDLVVFIENNPPTEKFWPSWEPNLTKSIPNWKDIITEAYEEPLEWKRMENIRPKRGYDDLCDLLVRSIGLRLAKTWFYSNVDDQRKAVKAWIFHNVGLWSEFDSDMKGEVLTDTFKRYPGEPLESLKELRRAFLKYYLLEEPSHRGPISFEFPFSFPTYSGYIPSSKIEQLRIIIKEAGDNVYLAEIDEMIARRERACGNMSSQTQPRVSYSPNENERELIARLMEITGKNGYLPTALPPIFVSSETPPIFVAYPEWEEEGDDQRQNRRNRNDGNEERIPRNRERRERIPRNRERRERIPRNQERRRPETISIEELLGVYQPRHERIVIYERGIRWRRDRFDEEWLFAVVLIHEIGHWITHMLPKLGMPTWATDLYVLGEMDVHEGWAQLMTCWIAEQVGGKFKETFGALNRNQSPPYRVFEQFKDEPKDKVMASLEQLRLLSWPARLQDWKKAARVS